jgi:hypothetical protein
MDSRLSSDDEYDFRMRQLTERQDLRQAAYKEYNDMPKHTLRDEEMHYHFVQYAEYCRQQEFWGRDQLFLDALSRLPNLTSVENAKHGFADNHLHFPWNRIKKDIILTPDNWMQLNAVEVDDDEEGVIDFLKKPVHMKHADCLLAAIGQRANSSHASPLRSLRLVNVGGQPFLDMIGHYDDLKESRALSSGPDSDPIMPGIREELPQELISAQLQGLSHLERLELDVTYTDPFTRDFESPAGTQTWQTKQLFQEIHAILSAAAHSLETLKLQCRDDEGSWATEEQPMNPENDTIAHLRIPLLPQLEHLRLSCNATEKSLIELLRAQSKTLRCLEIIDCDLNMGTWNSVLRQVPEIFETGLQRIYLEGLHDEDYPRDTGDEALFEDGLDVGEGAHPHDRAILKYLLHGGEMPELDFNSWYERNRELADRGITEWEDELLDSEESQDLQ